MKVQVAIRELLSAKGTNLTKIAESLGFKSNSSVRNMLKGDIRVSNMYKLLDALDYEIVIQPKSTRGKRANGAYVIDMGEDEKSETSPAEKGGEGE